MNELTIQAEMSVLGSCMLSSRAVKDVRNFLQVGHFERHAHQAIFASILDLDEEGKAPDDFEILCQRLDSRGMLGKCGGADYLLQIADYVPSPSNARFYAEIVVGHWFKRQLVSIANEAEPDAEDASGLRARVEDLCSAAAAGKGMVTASRLGTIGTGKKRQGVLTGIKSLDEMTTHGGMVRGQQNTVAAYHKGGKTSFLVKLALSMGGRIAYCTFADLDAEGLEERAMKQLTRFSFAPANGADAEDYYRAKEHLSTLQIDVYDPLKQRAPKDMETCIEWLNREQEKSPWTAVIFDYAQKLKSRKVRSHDPYEQANVCSDLVDDVARDLNVPGIVGTQVTLGKDGGEEQSKGNRIWEENTALYLRLHRFKEKDLPKLDEQYRYIANISAIDVKHNRFGPDGRLWAVWDQERASYEVID